MISCLKAISGSDIATLIGFEKQKQLLACTEKSCLSEIGGALGVDYLLSTNLSQMDEGEEWLLTVTLLSVAKAQPLARVSRRAPRASALADGRTPPARC